MACICCSRFTTIKAWYSTDTYRYLRFWVMEFTTFLGLCLCPFQKYRKNIAWFNFKMKKIYVLLKTYFHIWMKIYVNLALTTSLHNCFHYSYSYCQLRMTPNILIFFSYKMCLSKSLGHSRVAYGHPIYFPLFIVLKPHIIQMMCYETPMCTHCPHEQPHHVSNIHLVSCLLFTFTRHDLFVVSP